jgi:hypothetical protein
MDVTPAGICLPQLEKHTREAVALLVEHPPGDDDPLADGGPAGAGVGGEVGVLLRQSRPDRTRSGGLGQGLDDTEQVVGGTAQHRRLVVGVEEGGVIGVRLGAVMADHGVGHVPVSPGSTLLATRNARLAAGTPA